MTEALFLPAATLALWLLARAIEHPTHGAAARAARGDPARDRNAAAGRRVGAGDGHRDRARSVVRPRHRHRAAVRADPRLPRLAGADLARVPAVAGASPSSAFGAYGVTASSGYEARRGRAMGVPARRRPLPARAGAPLVAMLILAYEAARGRERDPQVRALVAVDSLGLRLADDPGGMFASRYVGQLAERDLIAAAPALFGCFVVWLSRGMPRAQPATRSSARSSPSRRCCCRSRRS